VRRCLGASFALFEMRVVLRELVARLDLRAVDSRPERITRRAITLVPESGGKVVAQRRAARAPSERVPAAA
jgi:cytochrome P450